MRYVGDLITDSRSDTNNVEVSSTIGISTADFLRYANNGQERLQGIILQAAPASFQAEQTLSIVANLEAYSINDNVYLGERIVNVDWSFDGSVNNYLPLRVCSLRERQSRPQGSIYGYIPRPEGTFLAVPPRTSSAGTIRAVYERTLDKLDTRRGQINGTPSGSIIDLTVGSGPTAADEALFTQGQYVCVSKADGTVMLYNGLISSYNAGNDELTLASTVVTYLVAGYALSDLANGYITVGKWSTTHSKLNVIAERYLIAYMNWRALSRDSATKDKAKPFEEEMALIEEEIKMSYQQSDKDEHEIHIENEELMVGDGWRY